MKLSLKGLEIEVTERDQEIYHGAETTREKIHAKIERDRDDAKSGWLASVLPVMAQLVPAILNTSKVDPIEPLPQWTPSEPLVTPAPESEENDNE